MNKALHFKALAVLVMMILLASAIFTTPAYADGGTPVSPAGTTTTTTSSQLSTGTGLVVLDNQGHRVPLGSQEAATLLASGDPIWCPSSVTTPLGSGTGGCTQSYSDLSSLIAAIDAHTTIVPNTNGTIWILSSLTNPGNDSSSSTVTIDGSNANFGSWKNYSLTLKGGWNGFGTGTVDAAHPSTFTVPIQIIDWNNNVTLSDLVVTGAAGNGLTITTTKNIALTRIQANSNSSAGVSLDNTGGTGTVLVASSQFEANTSDGLDVTTNGAITLTNVIANGNSGSGFSLQSNSAINLQAVVANTNVGEGAFVNNSGASSAQPVTLTGDTFSGDQHDGVVVYSNGAVTISNLTANGNDTAGTGDGGAYVDNTGGTAGVTLAGTNIFNGNTGEGLQVYSKGAITSGALSANNNTTHGVTLDNHTAPTLQAVTLSGTSSFSGNKEDGLDINSRGTIAVNNVSIIGNGWNGSNLNNAYSAAVFSAVKVTGTNWFANNNGDGLNISSDGAISMNNITANGDGSSCSCNGVIAANSGASAPESITLTGINTFNNNNVDGALIEATGAVNLSNLTAGGNMTGAGVIIKNQYLGSSMPQSVTLLGVNNLSSNDMEGLDVATYGAVIINNLTANSSAAGQAGADLIYGGNTGSVTLNGMNTFDSNDGYGLLVGAIGPVIASNLNAIGNNDTGAIITANSSSGVTLTGFNNFGNSKTEGGLDLTTNGPVKISNLAASSNAQYGAIIDNTSASSAEPVTLTGINTFDYNAMTQGLNIKSKGAISASNLNAIGNSASDGVDLDNSSGTANVTLSGANTFDSNNGTGLSVVSHGSIATSNLTADSNGFGFTSTFGVQLNNSGGTGSVTLSGTNTFDANYNHGLDIASHGVVTTYNLTANNNKSGPAGEGVSIDNTGGSPENVILNGINTFTGNHIYGLTITSLGAITTNNLTASGNGDGGVHLDNSGTGAVGGITLKGTNVILSNGYHGLTLISTGAVSGTHITSDSNFNDGIFVSTKGAVTITCGSFMNNGTAGTGTGLGVEVAFGSQVTLIGVDAFGNSNGDIYTWGVPLSSTRTCPLP